MADNGKMFQSDQDYLDADVAPPERKLTDVPGDDNEAVAGMIAATNDHQHFWKQIGSHIECERGKNPHGRGFDHLNQILIGTGPQGEPLFKTLDFSKQNRDDVTNVSPGVSNEG